MSDAPTTPTRPASPADTNRAGEARASSLRMTGGGEGYRHEGNGRAGGPRRNALRVGTVVVLVGSLVAAAVLRHYATRFQVAHSPSARRTTAASGASLAGMDTYALALLLGGLRGPLVMVLWAQSENQKADRNLEGVDTQIEWIRRLQPEFDSVHIFQMWNKAYNISVQMVGLSNKYSTILDAIDYGRSIDAERPDNLNILKEVARIYGDKLGQANPEKYYYRDRLRRESRHRELTGAQLGDPGFQRLAHDPVLDPSGRILERYLKPRVNIGPTRDNESYDGSDLQFLKKYEPFPYGVSPIAFGYNYHKRGQVLMSAQDQKPLQISESVVDSQPALLLKSWTEEEFERGRKLEHQMYGQKFSLVKAEQETPTADRAVDAPVKDASVVPEMLHAYDTAARLSRDAVGEYERHLRNPEFATKRAMYGSHIDSLRAMGVLAAADADYIRATQAQGQQRAKYLASAAANYRNAIRESGLTALRYFTPERFAAAVFPPGVNRANIGTGGPGSLTAVTDQDILRMILGVQEQMRKGGGPAYDENYEDRADYETSIARAVTRLQLIDQAANP